MSANTIILKGDPIRKEKVAGAAITPGHLLQRTSADKVVVHATAGGNAAKLFAIENDLFGNGITDAYAANDTVQFVFARPGDEIQAILKDGETAVIGSPLESAGDGTLQVHVVDSTGPIETDVIVGYALEAVDLSDSSGADPSARINIEVA